VTGTSLRATHGRSFYVMDNLHAAPVRRHARRRGAVPAARYDLAGWNACSSYYYLKAQPKSLTLEVLDAGRDARVHGHRRVRRLPPGRPPTGRAPAATDHRADGGQDERATWDLASRRSLGFRHDHHGARRRHRVARPCQVKLTADGVSQTQAHDQETPAAQHQRRGPAVQVGPGVVDKVNEANLAVIKIRRIKTEAAEKTKGAPKEIVAAADTLTKNLAIVEEEIYQVKNQSGQDPLNFPIRTNNRLASLLRVAVTGEGRPTSNVGPIFDDLVAELKAEQDKLDKTLATDLVQLNRMLTRIKKDPISEK
jgi:hypothetical protein